MNDRPEVIIRLDRILMGYELVDWSDAIRQAFIPESHDPACDQAGLDAIHDRLDEIATHLRQIQGQIETAPRQGGRSWKLTLSRAGLVIEIS